MRRLKGKSGSIRGAVFAVIVFGVFYSVCFGYSGGSGEPDDPYRIGDVNDLLELAGTAEDYNKCFILTADINMEGQVFTEAVLSGVFTGTFDGNGHEIAGFTINGGSDSILGLFKWIDPNGKVENLGLEDCKVSGEFGVGSLAGSIHEGSIMNCYSTGDVNGSGDYIGGLVGHSNAGNISSCYSAGTVSGSSNSNFVGGLVGYNNGGIRCSYSTGSVSSSSYHTGGLVGTNEGVISDCYSTGSVNGEDYVGGLAGGSNGNISNCYSTGSVTGSHLIGGLVGVSVDPCYTTNSFWDVNSSGQATSEGGTGETTVEMQTMSTFTDAGWDFVGEVTNGPNDIWRMCIDGVEYPKLWWEFTTGDFVCPDGVDFVDFAVLANTWLLEVGAPGYNPICDISEPGDETIDMLDLNVFTDNWLVCK